MPEEIIPSEKNLLQNKRLICAPMATLSHEAYRMCVEQFGGCDEYFTEMINAGSLLNNGPFEKYYIINECAKDKIVWQLTGNKISSLAEAASVVAKLEGIGVDINMGCSAPQIYKTGAGIAWMLKPLEETEMLIKEVKAALDEEEKQSGIHKRLSIKCRLGDEDFTKDSFFSFTDMLVKNGVELITLHPRTLKEKYRLLPKYEYAEELAQRYKGTAQVYVNGAVSDIQSAQFALSKTPSVDGLMIARAAAQKPWIFDELKGNHHTVDCKKLAFDFIDNVVKYQPQEFYRTRLQRFFNYWCLNFSFAHYFQTQMLNAKTVEEFRLRIEDYFDRQKEDLFLEY